ncbi:MAG TPA: plastocyanin/azurin family copper-binding protein [Gemmatimonadaceae bacterium]|nr:plastocyanin/azurin family copper-binding protein [Gemmatimonadaceae bacterium]
MTAFSRRDFVKAGGFGFVGFALHPIGQILLAKPVEVIEMRSDAFGSRVWFDPIGLFVEPGTTVRWTVRENVHTATAYHPDNDHHSLRIPERAIPWDSGYLVHAGAHFDVKLTVPGVYDYYCAPHEAAGMVGRIVVGKALGPGSKPFDYWLGKSGTSDWRRVPDAARSAFPTIQRIIAERRVHLT